MPGIQYAGYNLFMPWRQVQQLAYQTIHEPNQGYDDGYDFM